MIKNFPPFPSCEQPPAKNLCRVWLLSLVFFLFLAAPAFALQQNKPFSHYASQEELIAVLSDFARSQNLNVSFTSAVTGKVSGRFEEVAAKDFLNGMRAAFGVAWYEQGSTLYFYHESELGRIFISSRVVSGQALLKMLRDSSVLSSQLPSELMPGSDMLVITGPPPYLDQVRNAVAAFEQAQSSNFVMRVFPLKYAWAEDITINSMDSVVTIPGIASILRAMVSGSALTGSKVTEMPVTQQRLGGQGLVARGSAPQVQPVAPTAPAAPSDPTAGQTDTPQAANIIADPRVNSVLITDAEYRMPYYEKVIADLDKPVELVEIHAAIVDIDSNYQRDLGIDFQGGFGRENVQGGGSSSTSPGTTNPVPSVGEFLGGGLSLSTLYSHGADFFMARINALEEDGEARVLGRPSVLTMDNVQATLENTSTYYIQVQGKDVADLFKVEAGTILKVTPHIIPGAGGALDSIKLVVNVQDDQDDGSLSSSEGAGVLPPIKQTKINTQAIVGEGQSLLIGGYYFEKQSSSDSGIPLLKNIPILGGLFKTQGKTSKRMERLILITPRIIRLDHLPDPPERVNSPSFHRYATQDNFEEVKPVREQKTGGCARQSEGMPTTNPTAQTQSVTVKTKI